MNNGKKWHRKHLVPIIFYSLIAVFFVLYVRTIDFSQLEGARFEWSYLAVASIFGLAFRYWGTLVWFVLLKGLGATNLNDKTGLIYVYARSWLGRYIPGTAPWILGKIYFASKHGISKDKLAVSSLLEGALQVVVVMFMALIMLVFDKRFDVVDPGVRLLLWLVMAGLIICMVPAIFNRIVSIIYKLLRKKTLAKEHLPNAKLVLRGVFLYAIGAILSGLSLFFVAKGVYPPLHYQDILFVMGVSNLAAAVSMLAIFAPSGIGVREGIQLVTLSVIIPREFALVIVVAVRLWTIFIDLVFLGAARLAVHYLK